MDLLWWQLSVDSWMLMSMNHFYFISVDWVPNKIRRHLAKPRYAITMIEYLQMLWESNYFYIWPQAISFSQRKLVWKIYVRYSRFFGSYGSLTQSLVSQSLRIKFSMNYQEMRENTTRKALGSLSQSRKLKTRVFYGQYLISSLYPIMFFSYFSYQNSSFQGSKLIFNKTLFTRMSYKAF